ncbi:unnamed protein product [Albugo candida]|uniref:Uncharacterized protein n=1 Tax=Albugo candida TaxID=65357 RepID=A0A024FXP1_9STRA|nr:unnamed protein product [Albugo candida]|eukprot:CCI11682.1 unnamed protein product [Albugo candida]
MNMNDEENNTVRTNNDVDSLAAEGRFISQMDVNTTLFSSCVMMSQLHGTTPSKTVIFPVGLDAMLNSFEFKHNCILSQSSACRSIYFLKGYSWKRYRSNFEIWSDVDTL